MQAITRADLKIVTPSQVMGTTVTMVRAIFAGVVAEDLEHLRAWYEKIFERPPDAAPMDGLYEWHLGENVLQLVALACVREIQKLPQWGTRGASSLTLMVGDARRALELAVGSGASCVSEFRNAAFRTASVTDPEGNLVTFMEHF